MLTHKALKKKALQRADVRRSYDELEEEFGFIDELLKARTSAANYSQHKVVREYYMLRRDTVKIEDVSPLLPELSAIIED